MIDPATVVGRGLANHLLADEDWAREKLRAHAGAVFSVASGPLAMAFAIGPDGALAAPPGDAAPPAVELYVSPFDMPAFLAAPERWERLVVSKGDPTLAATLQELAQTLPWFVERAFAKMLGPVVGQRVADTGRRLLGFPGYASERLAESVVSYARDEAGWLARADEARALAEQSAELARRADAIAERIAALEAHASASLAQPVA